MTDDILPSTPANREWQVMDGRVVYEILIVEVNVFLVEAVLYTGMK